MAEKVAGIIGLAITLFALYGSVIRYLLLKIRCTETITVTVEEVIVRRNKKKRHEKLKCSYRYGMETYTSMLQSPDKMFFKGEGDEIEVNINPNKPNEILKLTRVSTFMFIYCSVFLSIIISMFCGMVFGAGGDLFTTVWAIITNDFLNRLGELLFGIVIITVCILGFRFLIIGPFIAKYTDREVRAVLDYIEIKEGDTYEGKEWKKLRYRYKYGDIQYTYEAMTTDEDIKEGDEIILKVNPRKPHKAYEPYEDSVLMTKIIPIIVLGAFLYVGINEVISNVVMLPHSINSTNSYGSDFTNDETDASPLYISQCNRIEIKENVSFYLPMEYKEYSKEGNDYTYAGNKNNQVLMISIEETDLSVTYIYKELVKRLKNTEKVIGEERERIYNNNKYYIYEIDKKEEGLSRAHYVITVNNDYYIIMLIGWEEGEEDFTDNVLSSMKY